MDEKKKREKDTVPDIIGNGTDSSVCFRSYPIENSECTETAVQSADAPEYFSGIPFGDGDLRTYPCWDRA